MLKIYSAILFIVTGSIISIVSYFFNPILPAGIISPDFPPFYLFEIGIISICVGLIIFKFKKITHLKKKIVVVTTIVILIVVIVVLSVLSHMSARITYDEIRFKQPVWYANESITTEGSIQELFITNGAMFWNKSIDFVRAHGLYYPEDYTPLFHQMIIKPVNVLLINGSERWEPEQWAVSVPAIIKGSDWRYRFWDGYIESTDLGYGNEVVAMPLNVTNWTNPKPPTKYWSFSHYMNFFVDQKTGIIQVYC